MGSLQRSRTCLATPKKRTLDELKGNKFAVSGILFTTIFLLICLNGDKNKSPEVLYVVRHRVGCVQ